MVASLHPPACPLLAHSAFTGTSDFVNGLFHPLTSPVNLLLLAALGLALAQASPLRLRVPLFFFQAGALLGMAIAALNPVILVSSTVLSSLALFIALAVVAWISLPLIARASLAALVGLIPGLDSPEFSDLLPALSSMAGTVLGLSLAITAIAFYASLRPIYPWADIGLRILAAWIAAISLLLVAFALRA